MIEVCVVIERSDESSALLTLCVIISKAHLRSFRTLFDFYSYTKPFFFCILMRGGFILGGLFSCPLQTVPFSDGAGKKMFKKCAEPRVYINTYILIPGNTVMCVDTSDMYAKNTKICRIYPF